MMQRTRFTINVCKRCQNNFCIHLTPPPPKKESKTSNFQVVSKMLPNPCGYFYKRSLSFKVQCSFLKKVTGICLPSACPRELQTETGLWPVAGRGSEPCEADTQVDGGGSSREGRAEGVSNVWIFLQEKRSCRTMSSPVTCSASCSCFVRGTTQVCGTQGWMMTPRHKCCEAGDDRKGPVSPKYASSPEPADRP